MSQESLVSVIIPCYNQVNLLRETVLSVVNSSYRNIEIIVVNDGSTDNTDEIAKQLVIEIPFLKYYFQENRGPSAARNFAISNAMGSIILPLDADDLISHDYIEKAVLVLESNPDVKVVYCEAELFGEKSGKWDLPDFTIRKLARRNLIFSAALYRKADWERIGGYDEYMTWSLEDWDFWLSMLKNGGGVTRLPITGFFYRIQKNTRTENARNKGLDITIDYFNKKHKDFFDHKLGGPLRRNKKMSKVINMLTGTTLLIRIKKSFA
jgi:glycosyltransferase involved in cell wall biosynthesis